MKRFYFTTALFLWVSGAASAQVGTPNTNAVQNEGRAPYRTEFISYDIRKEADTGLTAGSKYFRGLAFKPAGAAGLFEASVEIPGLWLDRDVYIRDTGRTGRYVLAVNGREIGLNTDSYGTNEYYVTPFLREGANRLTVEFDPTVAGGDMERFEPAARRTIDNLFLWSQPRIHIFDYTASGHHDEEFRDAVIDLAVVVVNGFNMPETVTVGYDVFGPDGQLREISSVDVEIPGRGCDTVLLRNKIMGTAKFQYSAANPALYRVMLWLKQGGRNTEYIPFRLGFGLTEFDGERVMRGGVPIAIKSEEGDFPVRTGTLEKLRAMKKRGVNTVAVTRPQQVWFYDMCASEGLYIIDRAAVECDPRGGDRGPDGTVANDPRYLERFIDRQQAMFYRGRNYPNVIGWSIGSDSGNGYNMYKSYQWLREADPTRPVIYPGADGEWNTDFP